MTYTRFIVEVDDSKLGGPSTGLGMFVCTYTYMLIWVYTGEVNAKRIRERYLEAVLRQDIQFFDKVGSGEVATRIQTDTRKFCALFETSVSIGIFSCRFGATRNVGESRYRSQLYLVFYYWLCGGICSIMATCSGAKLHAHLHWYNRCSNC